MLKLKIDTTLSWILIFALTFGVSTPPCLAGEYEELSKEYVDRSHQMAKQIAFATFQSVLIGSLFDVMGTDFGQIEGAFAIIESSKSELERILQKIRKSDLTMKSVNHRLEKENNLDPKDAEELYRKVSNLSQQYLEYASVIERISLDVTDFDLSSQVIRSFVYGSALEFEKRLTQQCRDGVAVDLRNPTLPQIPPLTVPLSVQLGYKIFGTDSGVALSNTSFVVGGGMDESSSSAKWALLLAGSQILGEFMVSGNVVMAGAGATAASGAAAGISLAGAAVGLGIFAAVAVGQYIYLDLENKKMANDLQLANRFAFDQTANSETVRNEFKNICQTTLPMFKGFASAIEVNLKEPTASWKQLESRVKATAQSLKEYSEKLNKKRSGILQEYLQDLKARGLNAVNPYQERYDLDLSILNLEREKRLSERQKLSDSVINNLAEKREAEVVKKKEIAETILSIERQVQESDEQKEFHTFIQGLSFQTVVELIQYSFYQTALQAESMSNRLANNLSEIKKKIDLASVRKMASKYAGIARLVKSFSLSSEARELLNMRYRGNQELKQILTRMDDAILKYVEAFFLNPEALRLARENFKNSYEELVDLESRFHDPIMKSMLQSYSSMGEK